MKNTRHVLCLVMVCMICITMALSVSALTAPIVTEGYGRLNGQTVQDDILLTSTVTVTKNTDRAKLRIQMETQSVTGDTLATHDSSSSRGVTSFEDDMIMFVAYEAPLPYRVYCAYEVYSGGTYESSVIYKNYAIDTSVFN